MVRIIQQKRIIKIKKHIQLIFTIILTVIIGISVMTNLTGCSNLNDKSAKRDFFAMDTYMQIVCYGKECEEAVDKAEEEIKRLELIFDTNREDSEVTELNKAKKINASNDMLEVVRSSIDIYISTDGAFDITLKPIIDLWGFSIGTLNIPTQSEIDNELMGCGSDRIVIDVDGDITIGDEQMIDLGGIAKGYATDRLKEILDSYEITSAYMSLGGNIYCYNKKVDGTLWNIGIRNPKAADESDSDGDCYASISVADKAVITSGGYERYLTDDKTGKRYIHIIDPKTGRPSESDILSATIVSEDATFADGLSTACFVMGSEEAVAYWQQHREEFDIILYTIDNKVIVSSGLEDNIKCYIDDIQIVR